MQARVLRSCKNADVSSYKGAENMVQYLMIQIDQDGPRHPLEHLMMILHDVPKVNLAGCAMTKNLEFC